MTVGDVLLKSERGFYKHRAAKSSLYLEDGNAKEVYVLAPLELLPQI
jgi:hypothetical protein